MKEKKEETAKQSQREKKAIKERERERKRAWNIREVWWQAGERVCAFHVGIC